MVFKPDYKKYYKTSFLNLSDIEKLKNNALNVMDSNYIAAIAKGILNAIVNLSLVALYFMRKGIIEEQMLIDKQDYEQKQGNQTQQDVDM